MALGYNSLRTIALATANPVLVKPSAGEVCGWSLYNQAAYSVFLKLYNSAVAPVAGAGTPTQTIAVLAGTVREASFGSGIAFDAGIGFTITKLVADADTTVLVAGDLVVNLFYK